MAGSETIFMRALEARLKETFFLVNATHFEAGCLREAWNTKVSWEHMPEGNRHQVGNVGSRPVVIQIFWVRINGKLIGFWEATSQIVDYEMIDKWFRENCNPPKWNKGRLNARCNPANFHLCVNAIEEGNR